MARKLSKNRALSLALTIAMAFSMFAGMTLTSFADVTAYDGQAETGNYTISTAAQLTTLTEKVTAGNTYSGSTFTLLNNITAASDWAGIGNPTISSDSTTSSPYVSAGYGFAGTLDGGGHTVTVNRTASSSGAGGVVNYLAPGGIVKNLTVAGTVNITGSVDAVGGVVGYNSGTITNVTNNAVLTATSAYNVGGISGFNNDYYGTNPTGLIEKCLNAAAVNGYRKVGGITGENAGTIDRCANTAPISSSYAGKNGVGGIAGRAGNNNTAAETSIITNSYNTADITCSNGKWVGGITGFLNAKSSCTNCYNTGNMYAVSYTDPISGNTEGTNTNCYGLETASGIEEYDGASLKSETYMKSAAFVTDIAGSTTDVWTAVSGGYPTLAGLGNQGPSTAAYTISLASAPTKLAYTVGETFSTAGMVINATDADNNVTQVTDYTVSNTNPLTVDDTTVTVSGSYQGVAFSFTFDITVSAAAATTVTLGGTSEGAYTNLADALNAAGEGGTVLVEGTTTIDATSADVTLNNNATVKRASGFAGTMFNVNAGTNTVTLTTMTIDGESSGTLFNVVSGTLRLRGNVTLTDAATGVNVAAGAKVVINKAVISTTQAVNLATSTSNCTLEDYGGTSITGNIYLADGAYVTVAAALQSAVTVECANEDTDVVVAKVDATNYAAFTETDLGYVSNDGDLQVVLSDDNTEMLLSY